MDTLESQFVTYPIALKLKKLGFDEKCFGVYINGIFEPRYKSQNSKFKPRPKLGKREVEYCTAVLWQQAIEWLESKHGLIIKIFQIESENNSEIVWDYSIYYDINLNKGICYFREVYEFPSREIATIEAILKSLELIQQ